jgi:hypothetical protein
MKASNLTLVHNVQNYIVIVNQRLSQSFGELYFTLITQFLVSISFKLLTCLKDWK